MDHPLSANVSAIIRRVRITHRLVPTGQWCVLRTLRVLALLLLFSGWVATAGGTAVREAGRPIAIDANYPGGNIVVERIEGDTVYLRPDLRDTEGWWFYWNLRVRGAEGRALTFRFSGPNPIGVRGPAVSTDQGRTWSWLGAEAVREGSFQYTFGADAGEVRLSFAIPYQEQNLKEFLARYKGNPQVRVQELCKSKGGRSVERLHVGRLDGAAPHRVLVTARHHACEAMANYVMEGLLESILADHEDGYWFRRNVEVLAVPFMDKDGVEEGDQGKNRKPRDHNRDYLGQSIHPSVAALRTFAPNWSNDRLKVAFDLHCPHIRGPHNEVIYIVGSKDERMWRRQSEFGRLLEAVQNGPLVYRASDNLPFGKAWNTGSNTGGNLSFGQWAGGLEGIQLAASFEIPYANAGGRPVTADNARAFGRSLARALRGYLERIEREENAGKAASPPVHANTGRAPGSYTYVFPDGFSAQWVRIKTNKDCQATVYFIYN